MSDCKPGGIFYKNIRVNSVASSSGVFAGSNSQFLWSSNRDNQAGFGKVIGESNSLENSCSVTSDSESSSELLERFREFIDVKIGRRGL